MPTPPPPPTTLYTLSFLLALLATALVGASLRLLALLTRQRQRAFPQPPRNPANPHARVVIVLGSGGHTHEMLDLLRDLDTRKYVHRTYVVSSGDAFSGERAVAFEKGLEEKAQAKARGAEARNRREEEGGNGLVVLSTEEDKGDDEEEEEEEGEKRKTSTKNEKTPNPQFTPTTGPQSYTLHTLPRARKIHQPLSTTPLTALRTLLAAFPILLPAPSHSADMPDMILTNGPGTAVVLIYAALVLRFFDVRGAETRGKLRTVYVESFARVSTLSLSARLVGWCVDRFVVRWEGLKGRAGGRAEYWGILV